MVYNRKDFIDHTNQLIPEGFDRMLKSENIFVREWIDRMERMDCTGREYFPHGAYFQGVIVSISFYSVENILKSVLDKYNIQQRYGNSTIHFVLNDIEGVDYSIFNTKIHDEVSFQIVAEEIKKIIEYGAMPFFEKYSTLEKVFEKTEQMPINQMVHFIGQPLPQRRMVIKKLCNDPKYDEYVKWLIDYYKSEKDPDLFIIEKLNEFLSEKFR